MENETNSSNVIRHRREKLGTLCYKILSLAMKWYGAIERGLVLFVNVYCKLTSN